MGSLVCPSDTIGNCSTGESVIRVRESETIRRLKGI